MWKLSKADFKLFRIKKSVGFSHWMHVKWTGDERSVWMEGSTLYIALHTDIRSSILNKNTDLGFIIPITNTYTQILIDQCNDQSIRFSIKIRFKSHKYMHRRLLLYKLSSGTKNNLFPTTENVCSVSFIPTTPDYLITFTLKQYNPIQIHTIRICQQTQRM